MIHGHIVVGTENGVKANPICADVVTARASDKFSITHFSSGVRQTLGHQREFIALDSVIKRQGMIRT